ncbi:MAG: Uma2 family endonuclease [Alphaproteobacteria bacterium]|jgi:Uma2 family endonuclease|nr:Uma2 family endonuclease [Alphaproteobacteria bacterium]
MTATTTLPTRRKLDVDAYHRMAEVGIFAPDERIELIDGEIYQMVPIGSEHGGVTSSLVQRFVLALRERAFVTGSMPLRLDALNEPEPDVLLLRPRADRYRDALPGPADVLLVVEVAKSSLDYDRTVKAPLYARAGVAELWIVDLVNRRIEVHREPGAHGYGRIDAYATGTLAPAALAEASVDVDDLFA